MLCALQYVHVQVRDPNLLCYMPIFELHCGLPISHPSVCCTVGACLSVFIAFGFNCFLLGCGLVLPACRPLLSSLSFTRHGLLCAPIAPPACDSVFPSVPAPVLELRRTVSGRHFHVAPQRFPALPTLERLEQTCLLCCAGLTRKTRAHSNAICCSLFPASRTTLHFWTYWRCASSCGFMLCPIFCGLSKKAPTFQDASHRALQQGSLLLRNAVLSLGALVVCRFLGP